MVLHDSRDLTFSTGIQVPPLDGTHKAILNQAPESAFRGVGGWAACESGILGLRLNELDADYFLPWLS